MAKKEEIKVVKRTKVEKEMTLLRAIERIVEVSKDSKLKAEAQADMADEVRYVAERYGITERQAILFCVCMERGPRRVDYDDLASHLDVSNIRILSYAEDIDALVRRRLLRYRDAKDEDEFDIPQPVIKALKHNEVYELPARTGLDCASLFFKKGWRLRGWRILSNMAEFKLEDAAIWRSMGWRLREAGQYNEAEVCFRKALKLRNEEGQSRRDLALVLSESGKASKNAAALTEAMALLKEAAFTNFARRSGRRSNDRQVSIVALEELNALIAWCAAVEWPDGVRPTVPELDAAYRRDLPVKIRIVLSWDADETDIDLHVLEPDGEEAYYGHRRTSSGGFVSEDVTTGYGPEEYLRKEGLGTFKILSNYFASHQTALTGATTVTATVYTDWGTAAEKLNIITLRLDKPKDKHLIGEVKVE